MLNSPIDKGGFEIVNRIIAARFVEKFFFPSSIFLVAYFIGSTGVWWLLICEQTSGGQGWELRGRAQHSWCFLMSLPSLGG